VSLNGSLEDLPLLDILQIVSFSKKTGHLAIHTAQGDGAIVFHDGLVVSSFTWNALPLDPRFSSLSPAQQDALVRTRIEIALEQLIRLRDGKFSFSLTDEAPRQIGGRDLSGETLRVGINPQELILELARGIDEDRRDSAAAVEASFAQPEELAPEEVIEVGEDEIAEEYARFPLDGTPPEDEATLFRNIGSSETMPMPAIAPRPIDPTTPPLGTRAIRSHPPQAPPEPPVPRPLPPPAKPVGPPMMPVAPPAKPVAPTAVPPAPVVPAPPAEPPGASSAAAASPAAAALPAPAAGERPRTLLLVDDESDVRTLLAGRLAAAGYEVVEAADPETAVKTGGKLAKEGKAFLLVTDLGMPTSGGSSFHGGFEVVKRLWKMNVRPPVLMMTESLNPALHLRAKQMGISSFVFKPGLSKLNPKQFEADLLAFASKIVRDILPRLAEPPAHKAGKPARPESPGPAEEASTPTAEELSRQFVILQRRLGELRGPTDANQISVLIMKVAREFFERAILFLVKNEEIRGLGGFGSAPKGQSINLLVREVVIPLSDPSLFHSAVTDAKAYSGALPEGKWSSYLMGKLGRFASASVALVPLVTHRETIAVLFGDNPETGRPFGRLDALEVFVNQAGVALERVFLQRKLQTLQRRS
jgi:CheY-like chemotaxis protein